MHTECNSNKSLFLEILVCLAVVDIALLVFELFHGLLFEDLIPTFSLELLSHYTILMLED